MIVCENASVCDADRELDRAHGQARGMLFGRFRLVLDYMYMLFFMMDTTFLSQSQDSTTVGHVRAVKSEPPDSGSFYHVVNRLFCFCAVYQLCRKASGPQTTFTAPHMSSSTTFPSQKWLSDIVWE